MRSVCFALIIVVAFNCIDILKAYKLVDTDFITNRFQITNKRANALNTILYPANIQEDSFFGDELEDQYRRLIDIESAASLNKNHKKYSNNNYNLDDLVVDDDDDEDLVLTKNSLFSRDEDTELKADPRDEETESHSSLVAGHQYVSGILLL